jgi:hypothetical protein
LKSNIKTTVMDLSQWWEALPILQKIYWVIAVPSTLIFIIQLIMLFVGGDADDLDIETDLDVGEGHGAGIDFFSAKSIVSFLMFFGWTGLAVIDKGIEAWWGIVLISFAVGLIMMAFTAWIFWMLLKLQESGNAKIMDALGNSGVVYITVPGKKAGNGKVQVAISGSTRTLDAVTEDIDDIKSGSFVEVVDVVNDVLVVTRKR